MVDMDLLVFLYEAVHSLDAARRAAGRNIIKAGVYVKHEEAKQKRGSVGLPRELAYSTSVTITLPVISSGLSPASPCRCLVPAHCPLPSAHCPLPTVFQMT